MIENNKPFTVISSEDNRFKFWIPKPNKTGRLYCTMSFNAMKYLPFIDALNNLPYVTVSEVKAVDDDLSNVDITLTEEHSLSRFIEDVSELIYSYVERRV